ncbi:putative disease resistance RPP13-like protein 1 [Corylus avellana]|uniref:putative disease resistance RPP13-like protein 1 n=1 Tax=Corylus avellana TaxID=13451 RepID=UPI00286C96F0|nr:putative disease resistance RPP13-like protein 1 [Corylus avellana]XP_059433862.1 putative disease resistance RPP13-like protein 1 [Corylus avellana]XP_059433863.1 putative disease resistance RPP13-like protein 1 [Corylus avellana]XP_059433864.1 putative disease resistance RPP13-like protein 1 [Corylus avellana]
MAELFLAPLIQLLFDKVASGEFLNFARRYVGLGEKLNKWKHTLQGIRAVLDDADGKQHDVTTVKLWLDDLRDLAYDVEDILDEFATEALQRKLKGGDDDQASTSKLRKLIPTCCTGLTPSALKLNVRMVSKIEEISARFNDIVTQKDQLNLKEAADRGRSNRRRGTLEPTSLMTDAYVYGREKDKEAILQVLLSEKRSDAGDKVSVIPILGMGGIGKTTLAKLLFQDEKVQSFFELKAWACVSEDFNVVRVTKAILKMVTTESCDDDDLNLLQVKLEKNLKGKMFLIVLDDLWNENYDDWTILRAPFLAGAPGSTIVITTRNERVSSTTCSVPEHHYRLEVLSKDACLSVFTQHALGASNFSAHLDLQEIGEKIVERCKGLPLAAKTLGGLLRTKKDRNEWVNVLKSKIWDIPEERSGIVPALMLSYHHLPSHLKRCFMYCSIFPEDYEFEEQQLVLLWMAEGLIQPPEGDKQMEDLGSEYFHDLLSRSFFQQSSTEKFRYGKPQFVMHDLINDLAQRVAGDICFRMEDEIWGGNRRRLPKKVRHSSYLGGFYDIAKKFEPFFDIRCLRTFLPLMLPFRGHCYLTHNVPHQLLPKLLCLRVLSLSGYYIVKLPDSIGDLKHLRYLDLSYTWIRGFPESTTTLCNLQTMILEGCSYLKKLPSNLGNLVNLRHLNILNANKLEGMPPKIGKLTHLQTLSNLIVEKGSCFTLRELGSLLYLRGTLIISQLENATEPRDASDAKLSEKRDLTTLFLEWSVNVDDSQDRRSEFDVLRMLQPHNALNELTIKCYGGTKFPTWFGHSFLRMVLLRIENCKKCTSLPPVGQLPFLKQLFIEGMASVKDVGVEFYGNGSSQPFRSLEALYFEDMEKWEKWSPNGEFPHLRELSIANCPKLLGKLPNHFPSLGKVVIERCQQLVVSISNFPKHCRLQIGGSEGVMHENKVVFNSLNSKSFSTISEFKSPIEGLILEGLTHAEDLAFENCEELTPLWSNDVGLLQPLPNLRVLKFDNCSKLVSLAAEKANEQPQLDLPSTLREIHISHCNVLEFLPKEILYNNTCLERIEINGCDSLKHFAIGQLPPTLKRLHIWNCENMIILLDEDDANSCSTSTSLLESLEIWSCPSLKFLTSSVELLATIKHLDIKYCGKLVSIAKSEKLPATLQHLTILGCEQLESIAKSEELPATLQHLEIHYCSKLESIAKSFHHNSSLEKIKITRCENLKSLPTDIHTLSHLDTIEIRFCPALVSFPDGGLLPSNLRELTIDSNMALPNCIHNITSLQNLYIWRWSPSVATSFSEEGFPASLTSLTIGYCNFTEALLEWGLHRLTPLQRLHIQGGCPNVESFREKMLPASLTTLSIADFPNLKYLSSLRDLASLQDLQIYFCKNLTSFPEDGLPPSLQNLIIKECPLLKEHCKKDQGREWSKIAHIPCVLIDNRFVFES